MIIGIGTDIVSIARMRSSLERFGDRFAERILAPCERQEYAEAVNKPAFLAKRFAAKEATAKAFGTGFTNGLAMHHIGVGHDPRGRPEVLFFGQAKELAEALEVDQALLSLSDEREHAIAFVILSRA